MCLHMRKIHLLSLFVDKTMLLKPFYICQLSFLSLSVCLFSQSHTWAQTRSQNSLPLIRQNDLELPLPSTGTERLSAPLQDDHLQPLNASQNPVSLEPDLGLSTPPMGQPQPSISPLHQAQVISVQDIFSPVQATQALPVALPQSDQPHPPPISKIPSRAPVSSSPDQQPILSSTLAEVNESSTIPANPTLFSNRITQVPESPPQSEPAGRRPRVRTQPSEPDETPLDLRQELLTPKKIYSPSITILTPSAYGKSWRQASVGFGFQHRTRFSNSADGAFGVGFGLGDAQKYVGLDVGLTLTDLDNLDRGIISFKLHRQLPSAFAVAVGVNDAISWGDGDVDGPSPYGVITKTFVLKESSKELLSRVYVSAGAGTGRYRTENNVFTDDDTPGVFGSVALRVADPVNVIAEWSGQDLSLGLSLRPFRQVPLIITPAITDITGTAGDGVRFILGVGYAISF